MQPFSIGKVEERMMQFAKANAITLASDELYMSAKQLQHCLRASKATKGLVVTDADLIGLPQNRFQMDLYYDGEHAELIKRSLTGSDISKYNKSWPHVTSSISE